MPPISILIKPASEKCNMNCQYCFYHDSAKKRMLADRGFLSLETAELIVKKLFTEATDSVSISFQGGEPTLAGLLFFREFVSIVKKYNHFDLPVHYALQTNGTLLDENWCLFLKAHSFLVGISLDGTELLHNHLRSGGATKTGNYQALLKNIRLLDQYQVPFNILTVITDEAAQVPDIIYCQMKNLGFSHLQFIPCLDASPTERIFSPTPEHYGHFLINMYEHWFSDMQKGTPLHIRTFDNYLRILRGYEPDMCGMRGICSIQFVIEADGTVYPCDFYCLDDYVLGNIREASFRELYESACGREFLLESANIHPDCKVCRFFPLCRSGCKRERQNGKSIYCLSYQILLKKMLG